MSIKVTSWYLAFVPISMVYKSAFTKREVINKKTRAVLFTAIDKSCI